METLEIRALLDEPVSVLQIQKLKHLIKSKMGSSYVWKKLDDAEQRVRAGESTVTLSKSVRSGVIELLKANDSNRGTAKNKGNIINPKKRYRS